MRSALSWAAMLLAAVAFSTNGRGTASAGEATAGPIHVNGLATASPEAMTAGRIHIEYVPPKDPALESLYYQLMERMSLEKIKAIFTPFRLPMDIKIRTMGCGVANAWYQPVDGVPTITVCYEYLDQLWMHLPPMGVDDEPTQTDALVGQMLFAFAHEFGHLVFDVYDVPIFGHEEDAADNFAAFMMLHFRADAPRLIMGAAWSYHAYIKNIRENPSATLPLAAFSSNHGQPEERFFNLECMAYGSDAQRYADLVKNGLLPQSRAADCRYEYDDMKRAFDMEILPHIDRAMAQKVLTKDWLASAAPPRALR